MLIGSNQRFITGGDYYVDFDDMVIYNATPPNTDSGGNPYIGPLGDSTTPTMKGISGYINTN